MISLTYFVDNITENVPDIMQVIQPERVSLTTVDTSALLTGLMDPIVDSRVYGYKLPVDAVYPSITYELTGQSREEVDGYTITKTDTFIVSVQAKTLAGIINVVDQIRQALITYVAVDAAGGIEITDQAITYHNELDRYEAAMEVKVTHLSLPSQVTPAYYIYPLQEKPQDNQSSNGVIQIIDNQFVGLLVAQVPSNGVTGLNPLRDEIFNQIINKKPQPGAWRTEFAGGHNAGLVGSIVIWRDVFSTTTDLHYC